MVGRVGRKRRYPSSPIDEPRSSRADDWQDWEKDDEELDLEETLFGKRRARAGPTAHPLQDGPNGMKEAHDSMAMMPDEEVIPSCLFCRSTW